MYLATKPPALGDRPGTAALVRADDLTHVLGVEPSRKRGGVDEVAEHDGKLAAFGAPKGTTTIVSHGWINTSDLLARGRSLVTQRRDRLEQPATIANQGDTEVFQVIDCQSRQYLSVDLVLAECRLILLEATFRSHPPISIPFRLPPE